VNSPAAEFIGELRSDPALSRFADQLDRFFERLDILGDGNPSAIEALDILLSVVVRRERPLAERFSDMMRIVEGVTSDQR
jgi:hypothetical protein